MTITVFEHTTTSRYKGLYVHIPRKEGGKVLFFGMVMEVHAYM